MLKPHIVILGAGFGGTYTAKSLARYVKKGLIDVTIVNKTNYFLFTPLLHEVATGSLSPTSVAEPLREVFAGTGITLCQGIVKSVDLGERKVRISSIGSQHTLPYDYLVIATGAETNFYGIPGADKYCLPLKSLSDAVNIRTRIIDCFEEAVMCDDPIERARLLSFVVVGGGPTGVETVAELTEFVSGIIDRYYKDNNFCDQKEVKITLIHAGAELLQQFHPSLRKSVLDHIKTKGVDIRLSAKVTGITSHTLSLSVEGEVPSSIPTSTIIWAAGVRSIPLDFMGKDGSTNVITSISTNGRLNTDGFGRVSGDERAFALGDTAGTLPMLAQVAVRQAGIVAANIMASIKQKQLSKFSYKSSGSLVSIGKWFAVGEVFSRNIKGRFVWWMWRTVYLFKFASPKKRIRIVFEWTLQLFFPRDITKLT